MKRVFALLLTLALTLSLAACASGGETPKNDAPTTDPPAASEAPKLVTNVDDLLAALAPGAEILLAEGEFRLDSASNYGSQDPSPYYTWENYVINGFALQLKDLENVTIRGCGKGKTTLLTEPRSADVLALTNCKNITLENLTLGHTSLPEPCEGRVLTLDSSRGVTLKGLGLFGCGTTGVYTSLCADVTVQDCEIYDCSYSGIHLWNSSDITVNSCAFHSLGKEMPVNGVFTISESKDITISNCMVSNNYVMNIADCSEHSAVTFRNNQFVSNKVSEAVFTFRSENVVLEDNVFEDNESRNWYAAGSYRALDLEGTEVTFPGEETVEALEVTPGVATPVSTGDQKEVHVSTPDEFLNAIASDTCIILDSALLDLSTAADYKAAEADLTKQQQNGTFMPIYQGSSDCNYYWTDNFDGPALIIVDVSNLTIKAEGSDRGAHTISALPRYADVLGFENCSAITLSGFTAGHTKEKGSCTGGVFLFQNCENILVDNCGMYGCGTEGVNAESSRNIQIVNSEIYECSIAGIELSACENVAISGTLIRDIRDDWGEGTYFRFYSNQNVTLDGQPLDGNYHGN